MKFGQIVPTMESTGGLLNTDKVVKLNDEVQGTEKEPAALPAGVTEENVEADPNATPAEQAADVMEIADPEEAQKSIEIVQGADKDYATPANLLDEIQQAGNDAAANKGGVLSQLEAQSIQTSVESIMNTLGMSMPVMPVMEAYKGTWSGREAARVTMESVLDSAKEIGKRLISTLKAILEYAINFLAGLVKNRALMEKNVERLIKKAKACDQAPEFKEDTIHGRFVHALAVKGESNQTTIDNILADSESLVIGYGFAYEYVRAIRDGKQSPGLVNQLADTIVQSVPVIGKSSPVTENDVELRGRFAGGMSLALVQDDRGENTLRFVSNAKGPRSKDASMPAQQPSDVVAVLERALTLIRTLRKIEGTTNRISDAVKGIIRQVEGEYYNLRGNLGSAEYARKAAANKAAKDAQEILQRMIVRFPSMTFSAVKNTCDWASAQINNYR